MILLSHFLVCLSVCRSGWNLASQFWTSFHHPNGLTFGTRLCLRRQWSIKFCCCFILEFHRALCWSYGSILFFCLKTFQYGYERRQFLQWWTDVGEFKIHRASSFYVQKVYGTFHIGKVEIFILGRNSMRYRLSMNLVLTPLIHFSILLVETGRCDC